MSTFRVLHVCTGNICRSPMAEHLMREGLRNRLGVGSGAFRIESAGTWGLTGSPMEPHALTTLASYAVDGAAFRARELTGEQVATADLVLTASREHRAAAVVLQPRAAARTFTLREFARLTALVDPTTLPSSDPVERARGLVRAAAGGRGLAPPDRPRDDDLDDPYRATAAVFAACAELVEATLQGPLDLLAGAGQAARSRRTMGDRHHRGDVP